MEQVSPGLLKIMDLPGFKLVNKCIINTSLTFVTAIGTSVLLGLWIPCAIYKRAITLLVKVFRRDFGSILDKHATLTSEDHLFDSPSSCSVVTVMRIDGHLNLTQVRTLFERHVVQAKVGSRSNVCKYPQLKQYPVDFGGYRFWKTDKTFNMSNHVEEHEQVSMMPISKIHQELLNKTYPPKRSLWQVTIYRSAHQHRTYLAMRLHHCMTDGRSIMKLLVECLGNKVLVTEEALPRPRTIIDRIHFLASLPMGLVRLNAKLFKYQMKIVGHLWKCPENDTSSAFVGISGKMSLNKLKDISRVVDVSTSVVIISTITSAVTKFLNAKNPANTSNYKSLPVHLFLPAEGSPSTLANHQSIGAIDIPHIEDDVLRLKKYDRIWKSIWRNNHTLYIDTLFGVISALPSCIRRELSKRRMLTVAMSNIAGDQQGFSVGGLPCLAFTMSLGAPQGSTGISFTTLSFKDDIQVSVVGKESVITEKDVVTVARLVEREFLSLSKLILG